MFLPFTLILLGACGGSGETLSSAENAWCGSHSTEVWQATVDNHDSIVANDLDQRGAEIVDRWNRILDSDPFDDKAVFAALVLLQDEVPSAYTAVCRMAYTGSIPDVWSATYEGNRLLSDATQVWCSDNRASVEEVALQLGIGVDGHWPAEVTPPEFFRACTAAAAARGAINVQEPGDILVDAARVAGFVQPEDAVMLGGLAVCERFDNEGVAAAMGTVAGTVIRVIGVPQVDDFGTAADVVVGAASVTLCPEHSEAVASYG